jgi:hypothetical protein
MMKEAFTTADTEDAEDAQRVEIYSSLCAPSVFSVSAVVNLIMLVIQVQTEPLPLFLGSVN